jgi:hypothetical protein
MNKACKPFNVEFEMNLASGVGTNTRSQTETILVVSSIGTPCNKTQTSLLAAA